MPILADKHIRKLVKEHELISPLDESSLNPASYDLRLGTRAIKTTGVFDLQKGDVIHIYPGELVEVMTLEKLRLPNNISGGIGLRSYYARKGLCILAGLQIDPGFEGNLVISLVNLGSRPVFLRQGDPFCTVEFNELKGAVERPYTGPYQHQKDFPSEDIEFVYTGEKPLSFHASKLLMELESIRYRTRTLEFLLATLVVVIFGFWLYLLLVFR